MTSQGRAPCEVLKVAAASKPVSVAGAIAGVIRSHQRVEVHAIGAGAVNQAIKAIAISRGYFAPVGLDLICVPSFIDLTLDGQETTGIRLLVEVALRQRPRSDGRGDALRFDRKIVATGSQNACCGSAIDLRARHGATRGQGCRVETIESALGRCS
jgi:stage V sporulation protein S